LQNGLYFEKISLANVTLKGFSIKWNDKLNISIEKLRIVPQPTKKHNTITLEQTNHYIQMVQRVTYIFNSINIDTISDGDINGSFNYTSQKNGYITLQTPTLYLKAQLLFQKNILHCKIETLYEKEKDLHLKGNIFINTALAELYCNLHLNLHNDIDLRFLAQSNLVSMYYKVQSNKKITHLKYLIDIAHLPKEVLYWAYTAIDMKNLDILKAYGRIDYNDIKNAYKQCYIQANVNKLNYTYNPELDAIHTHHTELTLQNGIFYIRPKQASSYGMDLKDSWLKIDFTKEEELLTLFLLFDGQLNKNMLHILHTYQINLPFLQHSGSVATNLKIDVNLRTIAVNAHGKFFTKKGNFDYLGMNLNIFNAYIKLDNYNVNINKMYASLKDLAGADVKVAYNAKRAEGIINFSFNKIKTHGINLATHTLKVNYAINPKGDNIYIYPSQWHYDNYTVSLKSMKVPFNIQTLVAIIPTSSFNIKNLANGYLSGNINLKKNIFDFNLDLLKLHTNTLEFTQSNMQFNLHYEHNLIIQSLQDIYFQINTLPCNLKKSTLVFHDKNVTLERTHLTLGNYLQTKLFATYNISTKRAKINLEKINLINPKNNHILYKNNALLLNAKLRSKQILINSTDLNSSFVSNHEGWGLHIYSLAKIAKYSNFLQDYNLTQGSLNLHKYTNKKDIQFQAKITYPYGLLMKKDKAIYNYNIQGTLKENHAISCKINNRVILNYKNKLKIQITNEIIDINQLLLALKTLHSKEKVHNPTKLNILLNTSKTQLYLGNNRYILSDTIALQYYNDILTAQLKHHKGYAGLKYQNNHFHLYGYKFDDVFMTKLLSLSKFYHGNLEFSFNGKLNDYKGVLFLNNTTIKEYRLLNNILAFINTVPSLITFSLPGYDKYGLAVKEGYINFTSKNDIFTISDIYLNSKELKILGRGKASIKNDMIDIILNLKTDLGSNLAKIPLVGYILLDGDSISTTLKITGKLTNPKVASLLAKDIVVAPLNIIKRTLTLPYNLIKNTKNTLNKLK